MKKYISIPNVLTFYRIVAIPFIVFSICNDYKNLFVWLICLNLISDILDGLTARMLNLCTEFGAKLDSFADLSTFILAISGFWFFEKSFVLNYKIEFILMFSMFLIPQIVSLIKHGRNSSFHLYSSKITGYLQGIFIFSYFVFGFNSWYFYFMLIFGILSEIEVLLMVLWFPKIISNAKTFFYQYNISKLKTV